MEITYVMHFEGQDWGMDAALFFVVDAMPRTAAAIDFDMQQDD